MLLARTEKFDNLLLLAPNISTSKLQMPEFHNSLLSEDVLSLCLFG